MATAGYESLKVNIYQLKQLIVTQRIFKRRLTPGGTFRPQNTAPDGGTTRGRWPGAPEDERRDSLMMPRCSQVSCLEAQDQTKDCTK